MTTTDNEGSLRFWRKRDCISTDLQQDLMRQVDQLLKQQTAPQMGANRVDERTSPLMRFGRLFQKDHYGISKRRIVDGYTLVRAIPTFQSIYFNTIPAIVSQMLGIQVFPCSPQGSVCLLLLVYDQEGDSIATHADHCYFPAGQTVVTALLCLHNDSRQELCTDADAVLIEPYEGMKSENMSCHPIRERELIVFKHYELLHAVRPALRKGERRVMVSMIFAEQPYPDTIQQQVWEAFKAFSVTNKMNLVVWLVRVIAILVFLLLLVLVWAGVSRVRKGPKQRRRGKK